MKKVIILFVLVFSATCVFAQESNAGPWPQFRGPNGMGISRETNLPLTWSEGSDNIRWKTNIPGYGVSSPVVSGGKVFITTSYKSQRAAHFVLLIQIMGGGCMLAVLLGWILRLRTERRRFYEGKLTFWPENTSAWIAELFVLGLTSLFAGLALWTFLAPMHVEAGFDLLGKLLAHKYPDLEKLVTLDPSVYAGVWLTGGALGLIGLALVAATVRGLFWRVGIAVVTTIAAWKLYTLTPLDEWYETIEKAEKLIFVLPGLIMSWLAVIGCFEGEFTEKDTETGSFKRPTPKAARALEIRLRNKRLFQLGDTGTVLIVLGILILAGLIFIPGNFFTAEQGMDRVVLCVDFKTGNILWETTVWTAQAERKHSDNSYATPTCATDGKHVLASFGGIVTCLDYQGNVQWQHLDKQYLRNVKYGSSSSPIIVDGLGIVLQGKEHKSVRPAWLAAFDMETGEQRWFNEPEDIDEGYSTPIVHRVNDQAIILVPSVHLINAFDVKTGHRLWSVRSPIDQIVASLALQDNILVAGGGTWGPKAIVAMQLADTVERRPRTLWQKEQGAPGCSSPVIVGDRLCLLTDRGSFTIYDLNNGEILWSQNLRKRHLASLVAADGNVYAQSTKGQTTIIQVKDEFKVLNRNQLSGKSLATPALADGCIVLRVGQSLYCIE